MANYFRPEKKQTERYFDLAITDLDGRCRGVGKTPDRTWFVPGAVTGDRIRAERKEISGKTGLAVVQKFHVRSPLRVEHDRCSFAGACGGCSCRAVPPEMQLDAKRQGLIQVFRKNVGVELPEPDRIEAGSFEGYRRICRLSTYYSREDGRLQVGFRKASSNRIAEITSCPVLKDELSSLLPALRTVLNELSCRSFVGHVELLSADNGVFVLIRINRPAGTEDLAVLQSWMRQNNCYVYVQDHDGVTVPADGSVPLAQIHAGGVSFSFTPDAFVQINADVNESMIATVLDYLSPAVDGSYLDLFSGIGNFSLPLAQKAGHVTGVEVVPSMVTLAGENAAANGISNAEFVCCDLASDFSSESFARRKWDGIVLDPGRSGAEKAVPFVAGCRPGRVVYVSCNPITATRDFRMLKDAGYSISAWSMFNMFPHTEHVETVVLLSRDKA